MREISTKSFLNFSLLSPRAHSYLTEKCILRTKINSGQIMDSSGQMRGVNNTNTQSDHVKIVLSENVETTLGRNKCIHSSML